MVRRKKNPRRYASRHITLVTRSAGVSSAPESSIGLTVVSPQPQITRAVLPCEIRIVDEEKREIEVCATSEAIDSYGTVFGYEASKDAFARWAGNVREMHNRVAVGRKVAIRTDDAGRRIYVRIRISKGAGDTWEKVKDGTLAGASIGAADVEWKQQRIAGQDVPVASRYDLVELSLVDLPSNPDALGVTFVRTLVRDGVPDDALLDELPELSEGDVVLAAGVGIAEDSRAQAPTGDESEAPHPQLDSPSSEPSGATTSTTFAERDGSLSTEDPAVAIAAAALKRGQEALAAPAPAAPAGDEPSAKQRRLAALGAPGYQQFADQASRAATSAASSQAPGEGTSGAGVGQPFDLDGDHETPEDYAPLQSGPTDGAVALPSPAGSVAHMAHNHHHTGHYDDPSNHREVSGHQHLDGTSHEHEHVMDHRHGDHSGFPNGHAHPHGHVPDHDHYYRVSDGSPIDSRLVTGEQVRTHEYVSAEAFRGAQGIEGHPLSADQFRVAASHDLSDIRALGPYSRNPDGPADAGTPDVAPVAPSADMGQTPDGNGGSPALDHANLEEELRRTGQCPLCHGQVRALDQDGKPIAGADANGNIPDRSVPMDGRAVVAEITRSLQPQYAALAGSIHDLAERLQRIEQTPQSGGPVLRAADRGSAFHAGAYGAGGAGKPTDNERYAALESLAGKISDPQVQTAVAAEMIRMQQEAAGLPTSFQVMPRAGMGNSRG